MSSNLESILDLNNHAVTYLCQGNHSATTSTLREAIKSLERCFREAKEATVVVASEAASSYEPPRKRRRQDAMTDTRRREQPVDGHLSEEKDSEGYVPFRIINVSSESEFSTPSEDPTALLSFYDRAFDFPSIVKKEEDMGYCSTQQSKTRLAAILLYNLGLAYHREGHRNGTSKDLRTALKFYREAYVVLKSAWANADFQEVFVLLLALLNNMSCIHVACFDVKDARQCIEWMNKALTSRQRCILTKKDYSFFSMNVSMFRGNQLRYAAAA